MNGNATTRHSNVALLSVTSTMADRVTTSESFDEKLLPVLKRLKLPTGLLAEGQLLTLQLIPGEPTFPGFYPLLPHAAPAQR